MPMKPILVEFPSGTATLKCRNTRQWPPVAARLGGDVERLRASGEITDHQYEQGKTWVKVCGLLRMSPEKCPTCPFAVGIPGEAERVAAEKAPPPLYRKRVRR